MRIILALAMLTMIGVQAFAFSPALLPPQGAQGQTMKLPGRWRVKFNLTETGEKNLVFESKANGTGLLMLLDTGPDNKPEPAALPAAWSQTTNDRLSFSGEAEMPFGTCCREMGTLIFKGKFNSSDSISGKVVFLGSTTDEENVIGFRSMIGTFTATRVPEK